MLPHLPEGWETAAIHPSIPLLSKQPFFSGVSLKNLVYLHRAVRVAVYFIALPPHGQAADGILNRPRILTAVLHRLVLGDRASSGVRSKTGAA